MRNPVTLLILPAGCVLIIDQITKWIISTQLSLHQLMPVTPFLSITFILNKGAAFGFLSRAPEEFRGFFLIFITILAMAVVIFLYLRIEGGQILKRIPFSLILGGAIGNLIDRIMLGEVIDFIDLHLGRYHWPAFNIADSAITVGVSILVIQTIFDGKKRK